jgi:SHS2 domain-containing protein
MGEFELIEHDADIGIRVTASSLEELFVTAGKAFFSILIDLSSVDPDTTKRIEADEETLEDLMVGWLSELLFVHSSTKFLGREVSALALDRRPDAFHLTADVCGERYDPGRHVILEEIKTVTYHGLKVAEDKGRWVCEVILDI